MPSLLEALEKKYYADCQFDNDTNISNIKSNSNSNSNNSNGKGRRGHGCNTYDIAMDDTGPATDPNSRLISVFIPRVSPLKLVPELLVLNDCDIDCAGNFETIKDKCQRVRELDLAQNKLRDWKEVFHILKHMPRIEFLNLSKNQLMGPIANYYAPASISNLRSIVLNGTYLDWHCIDMLLEQLPILEELHLSLNDYREVLLDTAAATVAANNDITAGTGTGTGTETGTEMGTGKATQGSGTTGNTIAATTAEKTNDTTTITSNNSVNSIMSSPASPNANETSIKSCNCSEDDEANEQQNKCTTKYRRRTSPHTALKTLHFTGNPIENWSEICRLGRVFPSLQNLVLAQCPIKTLQDTSSKENSILTIAEEVATSDERSTNLIDDDQDCPYRHFENLRFLNLSCANINTWDDIDRIARFPRLYHVRVKNWPLWDRLECTEHERRQLLIARLPNVSLINGGGVISADEREDAERAFIRYYMDKPSWERPKRYDELINKHGKLDPLVNINLKPDKRVKVLLTFKDNTETRLVDIYRTVADLKVRLEKVVGLPPNKMRLYYLDQDYKEFGPEEMKYPNKLLYSYNIQNGDEIIIDEKK